MNSDNYQQLPPEMQARIDSLIAQAIQPAAQAPGPLAEAPTPAAPPVAAPPPAPPAPVKAPSLMDHVIALRKEVAELRGQVNAVGQVSEAVGNAVGQMYAMFQEQTQPSSFSANFQAPQSQQVEDEGY